MGEGKDNGRGNVLSMADFKRKRKPDRRTSPPSRLAEVTRLPVPETRPVRPTVVPKPVGKRHTAYEVASSEARVDVLLHKDNGDCKCIFCDLEARGVKGVNNAFGRIKFLLQDSQDWSINQDDYRDWLDRLGVEHMIELTNRINSFGLDQSTKQAAYLKALCEVFQERLRLEVDDYVKKLDDV